MVTLIVGDAKRLQISWHHPIDIYQILVDKYIDIKKYSYRNILIRARSIGSNNPDRDSMLLIVTPPILSTLLRPSESRIIPLMSVVRSVILSIFLRPFYVTYPSTCTDDLTSSLFHGISFTEGNEFKSSCPKPKKSIALRSLFPSTRNGEGKKNVV